MDDFCVGNTGEVESIPNGANPYDAMDMAGNVMEWVADWYDGDYYYDSPESNPPGSADGTTRVVRGGGRLVSKMGCPAHGISVHLFF